MRFEKIKSSSDHFQSFWLIKFLFEMSKEISNNANKLLLGTQEAEIFKMNLITEVVNCFIRFILTVFYIVILLTSDWKFIHRWKFLGRLIRFVILTVLLLSGNK